MSAETTPGPARDHRVSPVRAVKPSNWNVANGLTLIRIALVPLFIVLLLQERGEHTGWRLAAVAAFLIAMATDRVDGELARRWHLITDLGKIADPIADKALIGAALVVLSILGELWWWVTVVILVREVLITVLRFVVIRYGVMPADRGGKVKTVAQAVAIALFVGPLPPVLQPVAIAAMGVALILTLGTGVNYVIQAVRLRRTSRAVPAPE